MQSLRIRSERAIRDLDSIMLSKKQLKNILSLIHLESKTDQIYNYMDEIYKEILRKKNRVNSGLDGIPAGIAKEILADYGLTKESIKISMESMKNEKNDS